MALWCTCHRQGCSPLGFPRAAPEQPFPPGPGVPNPVSSPILVGGQTDGPACEQAGPSPLPLRPHRPPAWTSSSSPGGLRAAWAGRVPLSFLPPPAQGLAQHTRGISTLQAGHPSLQCLSRHRCPQGPGGCPRAQLGSAGPWGRWEVGASQVAPGAPCQQPISWASRSPEATGAPRAWKGALLLRSGHQPSQPGLEKKKKKNNPFRSFQKRKMLSRWPSSKTKKHKTAPPAIALGSSSLSQLSGARLCLSLLRGEGVGVGGPQARPAPRILGALLQADPLWTRGSPGTSVDHLGCGRWAWQTGWQRKAPPPRLYLATQGHLCQGQHV